MRRKNQKRGLTFTIMVAGCAGSGKTAFLNTLCDTNIITQRTAPTPAEAAEFKTVKIVPTTMGRSQGGENDNILIFLI